MFRLGRRSHLAAACISALAASACSDSTGPRRTVTPSLAHLTAVSGDWQLALQGRSVALPLKVLATDASQRPMAGVAVVFTVTAGGGAIPGEAAVTDAQGIAASGLWTLGSAGSQRVVARAGEPVAVFNAMALPSDTLPTPPSLPPDTLPTTSSDSSGPPGANLPGRLGIVRDGALMLSNSDGSQATELVRLGGLPVGVTSLSISPDRTQIAFVRASAGEHCIAQSNGTGVRCARWTTAYQPFGAPAWSPDGSKVVLGASSVSPPCIGGPPCPKPRMHLFILDTKSMTGDPLVTDLSIGQHATDASWSPDGRRIALAARTEGIFTVNADGSGSRAVIRTPAPATSTVEWWSPLMVRWSPDGTKLAAALVDENQCPWYCDTAVAVLNADGTGFRLLAKARFADDEYVGGIAELFAAPAWSPDGAAIAYGRLDCRGGGTCREDVLVVGGAGGKSRTLLSNAELLGWWP